MNITAMLAQIDAEIARLQQARAALVALESTAPVRRGPGRPPKSTSVPTKSTKRTMSPEARARIAAAQKKRWAAQKAGK